MSHLDVSRLQLVLDEDHEDSVRRLLGDRKDMGDRYHKRLAFRREIAAGGVVLTVLSGVLLLLTTSAALAVLIGTGYLTATYGLTALWALLALPFLGPLWAITCWQFYSCLGDAKQDVAAYRKLQRA